MNNSSAQVNVAAFPHINLNERSKRRGNEGNPRYVPYKGGFGDTNNGRFVFPRNQREQIVSPPRDRHEEIREALVIVNGD
ncbi:MAG TPA: hypothetical protein VGE31_00420 [Candidatus Paceibacterota bacterium]